MSLLTKTNPAPATEPAAAERQYASPTVDIAETKDEYLLQADMPGVNKAGLELLLEANELTIVGRRQEVTLEGELIVGESSRLDYRRTFLLDPMIDTAKISAQMEQGVLTVHLPKAERVKPRQIKITD